MSIPPGQSYATRKDPTGSAALPPQLYTPTTLHHNRTTSFFPYSSFGDQFLDSALIQAAGELNNKFILVGPRKFIDKYLPNHPPSMPKINKTQFMNVAKNKTREREMYEP